MNVRHRRALVGLAVGAAIPWLIAACGSGGATSSPSAATPSATSSAAPAVRAATWGDASGLKAATVAGGSYLSDAAGRALYTYDKDSTVSACNAECAATWPPVLAASGPPEAGAGVTKPIGTAERANGTSQVTYGGAYLYYYAADVAPGDVNGDGHGGVWHLAKP